MRRDPSKPPIDMRKATDDVVSMMKRAFHAVVQEHPRRGDSVPPQIGVVCTVEPTTGRPFDTLGIVIVVPPGHFRNDEDKDELVTRAQLIAVAGEAVAIATCLDTWIAMGAAAEDAYKRRIRASEHPQRREAMCVTVERRGMPCVCEYHPYRRLDDDLVFDDSERIEGAEMGGRFADMLPPKPTPRQASGARMLLSMGAAGNLSWTAL